MFQGLAKAVQDRQIMLLDGGDGAAYAGEVGSGLRASEPAGYLLLNRDSVRKGCICKRANRRAEHPAGICVSPPGAPSASPTEALILSLHLDATARQPRSPTPPPPHRTATCRKATRRPTMPRTPPQSRD